MKHPVLTTSTCWLLLAALGLLPHMTVAASANPEQVEQFAMDDVHWSVESDRFHCELELDLRHRGAITFSQPAGNGLTLRYRTGNQPPARVALAATTASWQPRAYAGLTELRRHRHYWQGDEEPSRELMRALDQGFWLALRMDTLELVIPNIHWHSPARAFRNCIAGLSPLSIRQARDSVLYFDRGERLLSLDHLDSLEALARYIRLDAAVQRVLIDSYTDNTGSRLANLQLSRERAADVAAALREQGVPESLIEHRAHGDRYPTASNDTAGGQDSNRKVTIRIIRSNTRDASS